MIYNVHYIQFNGKGILIISYETQRRYVNLFCKSKKNATTAPVKDLNEEEVYVNHKHDPDWKKKQIELSFKTKPTSNNICDLLICDEAHKLKNADSGLSKCLNMLPVKRRILLSGTYMENIYALQYRILVV